jgi:hypothetical protein
MSRRPCLILSVAFLAVVVAVPAFAGAASSVPDNIRLTWSESPKTTQTVGWRTDTTVSAGKVEYAPIGGTPATVVAPPPETLATNVGSMNLFSVTLRNLEPGTRYVYRVGDGTHWSGYYTFRTEPADPAGFEFLVFGDSHEKKPLYTVWGATISQAYRQNPEARFAVSVGDLIYSGKDYAQWQAWFATSQDVLANIPDVPVIGDHEPRGVTSKEEWRRPEYFVKLFGLPQNGPADFKGEVYSFDYGSAHIAVLNSSFTYEFGDPAARKAMIDAEVAWLDADLAASTKRWKLVVYHDATYNLRPGRSGTLTKMNFGPVIDKHHVDVVFNGHEHAMARSYAIRNGDFMPSAAEGTVYVISGRSGDNAKESLGPKVWFPYYYDPQAQTCYLVVGVEQDVLTITTRLQDGTVVDRFRIDKGKPARSTPLVPFGPYNEVRFAAFGSLLQFGNPPERNAAGEWFVDINALAAYLSGRFDSANNVFSYDSDEIKLQLTDEMFLDASKTMVSLAGLTSVGFYCRYHEAMNLVMVERWTD